MANPAKQLTLRQALNLSRTQIDILLEALKKVEQRALKSQVILPSLGICRNWAEELLPYVIEYSAGDWTYTNYDLIAARVPEGDSYSNSLTYALIQHFGMDWPLSRHPGHPSSMPVDNKYTCHVWKGSNLKARLSLIRYTRKRLRDWRRRTKE